MKKNVELSLAQYPLEKTTMSPAFYFCEIDVAFGFRVQTYTKAKRCMDAWVLAVCCIFTGATAFYMLESLQTQAVVQALERHGSRYGMPGTLFVDRGTNLVALESASFSLYDCNVLLEENCCQVIVGTAKSHQSRGKVERKFVRCVLC